MDPAGQLSLPIEALHHIGEYLSVEDVLNLSRTCHYLRSAFNDNTIWKRYVSGNICQLESLEQQVQPVFQCPETLSPLCEYRVHYMRQVHLVNNWRNGNLVKHSTEADQYCSGQVIRCSSRIGPTFYNNRYIFFGYFKNLFQSGGIAVWDVNETPVLHSFLPVEWTNFHLIKSNLVVINHNTVCVYQIALPAKDFPLLYSFIINEPEVSWQEEAVWYCNLVDHYLISNQYGDKGNIFYVWDILNATKVGTFVTPFKGFVSIHCHEGDNWIFNLEVDKLSSKACFFSFNINSQEFSDTHLELMDWFYLLFCYKSQIFLLKEFYDEDSYEECKVLCTVLNCKTLSEINSRVFRNVKKLYHALDPVVVNDKFVILCSNSVLIISTQSLETFGEIQFDVNVNSITHQFSFYGSFIIVVACSDDQSHVWDVEKKQKLPESLGLAFTCQFCVNDTFTKIMPQSAIRSQKIKVVHLW